VRPRSIVHLKNMDALVEAAEKRLIEEKLVHKGDVIGIISGTPLGATGTTNMMRLHRIGEK
jgi:pyruvate kinase